MLCSRVSFRLSVRQFVSRVILRGCTLINFLPHPIWAQHVVPAPYGFFLLLYLRPIEIGDFPLDSLDSCGLVYRLNVHSDDQTGFHIQKICKQTVIEFRRDDLQKRCGAVLIAHVEVLAGLELKGRRSDKVFYGKSAWSKPVP